MADGYFDFYELRNDEKKVTESLFAAMDLETTGLYADTDDILEIGIITFRCWSVVDTFHTLVNPGRIIPEASVRVHGITEQMVADGPGIADILPAVKEFIGDAVVVAHNPSFDLGFLLAAAERTDLQFTRPPAVDTCELARKGFPGLESYGLQKLAARFGISSGRAHRAVEDAEVCMKLLEIECEALGGKDLMTADLITLSSK